MIALILAVLSSGMVSIGMRLSEKRAEGSYVKLSVNYLTCALLSAAFGGAGLWGEGWGTALGLGSVNGVLCMLGLVMLQRSVRRNGVILSATFMKLGLLVPMLLSLAVFGERPLPLQWVGIALALGAIVLIHYEKGESRLTSKGDLLLLLLMDGGGLAMSKLFEELGVPRREDLFLLCTFSVALLLSVAAAVKKRERPNRWSLLYGLLIGLPNFFSYKLVLRALTALPAVVVYPTYSVGSLLTVTAAGVLFFRERPTRRQLVAIAAILAALTLLNLPK